MWTSQIILKFHLVLIFMCEYNTCSPLYYNHGLTFRITSGIGPWNVQHPGNRDEITDIAAIFTPEYWLPIEINVPDTFLSAWNGIGSAWTLAADYFSMGNSEMSPNGINQYTMHV